MYIVCILLLVSSLSAVKIQWNDGLTIDKNTEQNIYKTYIEDKYSDEIKIYDDFIIKNRYKNRVILPKMMFVNNIYLSNYEVTNKEYAIFLNDINYFLDEWIELKSINNTSKIFKQNDTYEVVDGFENFPVIYVSWFGAKIYTKWLSNKTKLNYRLPTKKEYLSLIKDDIKYKFQIDSISWNIDNSKNNIHQVGLKQANKYGLYDLIGNVWEWCNNNYTNKKSTLIGGSYNEFITTDIKDITIISDKNIKKKDIGFRVIRSVK